MDLKLLKSYVTVCTLGNFTRASEALYISQPALSRQIQELERELNCKLIDRSTRTLSLTENGYTFLNRAQEILSLVNTAKQEVSNNDESLNGVVHLGAVESSVSALIAEAITDFSKLYPHVQFDMYTADSDDLKRSVDEKKLDVAILIEPVESAKYDKISIPVSDYWGIVCQEDRFPPEKTTISYEELFDLPLILPRRYIIQEEIQSWLGGSGNKSLSVVGFNNLAFNSFHLVLDGFGCMLCIHGAYVRRAMPGLRFLPLSPQKTSSHVAVRKKNRQLSKAAELFWQKIGDL